MCSILEGIQQGLSVSVNQEYQDRLTQAGYTTADSLSKATLGDLERSPPGLPRAVARLSVSAKGTGQFLLHSPEDPLPQV